MREGHDNVTVHVFLGKSRGIRKNAQSNTTELAILIPEKLEPLSKNATQNNLKQLKRFRSNNRIAGKSFVNGSALFQYQQRFLKKGKMRCPFH
jgi:hypothetical protein